VLVLTNELPPYRVPLFAQLGKLTRLFRVYLSCDPRNVAAVGRQSCLGFDIFFLKAVFVRKEWLHPGGFRDHGVVHFPIDTYQRLKQERPDVVISGELGLRSMMAWLYCRSMGRDNCRLILWATVSERTEISRGCLRLCLRRFLLRRADAVVTNGQSGLRYVTRLGASASSVFTVPYVADPLFFRAARPCHSVYCRKRLLYVGQLSERKGLKQFIAVLQEWASRNIEREIEFVIAGNGPLDAWLRRLRLPRNLRLELLGYVPYSALPDVYGSCGIFVFPTLADEWGVAVNEAMAASLPVLGSVYSQAVEELVRDGVNGWVFRPDDPAGMRCCLERVMNTPAANLARMGALARESVARLTPEWAARQMWRVIEHVCKARLAGTQPLS